MAARQALEARDVTIVLPFVPEESDAEVRAVFASVLPVRTLSAEAGEVADQLFFETVVRVHRAGEGAPYTGLKPAGVSVGPVIPLAERAIQTGSPDQVATFLAGVLRDELTRRLDEVKTLASVKDRSLPDARRYVEQMLGFEVYSHHVFQALHAAAHGEGGAAHVHE